MDCREWIEPGDVNYLSVINVEHCLPQEDARKMSSDRLTLLLCTHKNTVAVEPPQVTRQDYYTTPLTFLCLNCGERWTITLEEIEDDRRKDHMIEEHQRAEEERNPRMNELRGAQLQWKHVLDGSQVVKTPAPWWRRILGYWNLNRKE